MTERNGAILAGLGVAMVVAAVVVGIVMFGQQLRGDSFAVPGETTQVLDPGAWVVFQEVGPDSSFLQASDVSVTGSDGQTIDVRPAASVVESVSMDDSFYEGVAIFDIPSTGSWTVTVDGTGPDNVRIGRSVSQNLLIFIAMVLAAILGVVLAIAGIIMMAIAWSRSHAKQ